MIHGVFDGDPKHPAPRVSVTIDLSGVVGVKHPSDPIDFLIDTGAHITLLHPQDAVTRVGLKLPRLQNSTGWSKTEPSRGVGGVGPSNFVVACRYIFRHDDGTVLYIDGEIRIAQPAPHNDKYPSLLGRDVLEHFLLSVAHRRGEVLLDHLAGAEESRTEG